MYRIVVQFIDRLVHTDGTASVILYIYYALSYSCTELPKVPALRQKKRKNTNDRCLKTRLCACIARQLESYLARLQVYYIVSILPGHNKCADCACIIRNSWNKIGNVYRVGSRKVILLVGIPTYLYYHYYY